MTLQPNPEIWPVCPTCKTPWVLRRSFVVGNEMAAEWLWQRDCKHRAEPDVCDANGTLAREPVSSPNQKDAK